MTLTLTLALTLTLTLTLTCEKAQGAVEDSLRVVKEPESLVKEFHSSVAKDIESEILFFLFVFFFLFFLLAGGWVCALIWDNLFS